MELSCFEEVESVLLELHTQLEEKHIISKPDFDRVLPRPLLMNKIRHMHDEVISTRKNISTMVSFSFGNDHPSTSSNTLTSHGEECSSLDQVYAKISRTWDIYYQNVRLFKNQRTVDALVGKICQALNVPQWSLGLLSTSKGLVHGPLHITLRSGETIDCSLERGGTLIPQNLPYGASYESSAKFGLILEKDTAFQNLISSGLKYPLNSCIMITGKGYPDMNTRLLVRDLSAKLMIPMFALVDGDPHGIDIFFNYKYGSLAKAHMNEQLAATHILWLGIHPTDMVDLVPSALQPLSLTDMQKIRNLSKRGYVKDDGQLREQLESLIHQERKCEIENIAALSNRYLNDVYLPAKISKKKFI